MNVIKVTIKFQLNKVNPKSETLSDNPQSLTHNP